MQSINISQLNSDNFEFWDAYVYDHPQAILYQLSAWQNVIAKTYGHKVYYLMATTEKQKEDDSFRKRKSINKSIVHPNRGNIWHVTGVLPLVHLKSVIFGNQLVSMPFFDSGGLLVNDKDTGRRILNKTMQIARELNVTSIELRHTHSLSLMEEANQAEDTDKDLSAINRRTEVHSTKVRMLLELPDSPSILMKSFKSKLRSQIRKPIKEGLTTKIGGLDLLNDFYEVFCINMRDLGSPVHSRKLIENVLLAFSDQAKVVMVYKERKPLAGSVVVGFMDTLENPWSSSLRQYSKLSPNMLLYWTMLEYACENGYRFFDFGRSSPEEGTYKFKKQWGAKSEPLHWYTTHLKDIPLAGTTPDKSKFERAISYWQKLPVWVTKALGPRIRKYISL